jgi:hypothetical protein
MLEAEVQEHAALPELGPKPMGERDAGHDLQAAHVDREARTC